MVKKNNSTYCTFVSPALKGIRLKELLVVTKHCPGLRRKNTNSTSRWASSEFSKNMWDQTYKHGPFPLHGFPCFKDNKCSSFPCHLHDISVDQIWEIHQILLAAQLNVYLLNLTSDVRVLQNPGLTSFLLMPLSSSYSYADDFQTIFNYAVSPRLLTLVAYLTSSLRCSVGM